jgi:cytochrome c oxidase subunit 2
MDRGFQMMPEQASTVAGHVDALYTFLWAVSAFFTVLIAALIIYFAIKYRRRFPDEPPPPKVHTDYRLELTWTIIPLAIVLVMFWWGARVVYLQMRPPADTLDIDVIGKQWMWKIQHRSTGRREINELHVPLGRPVRLLMASQDVIHSFFIPAFRVKQDVVPGRYTTLWFQPTRLGTYHLFCAEYCGNQHSGMIGRVTVMEPADYEAWLAGTSADEPPAVAGERLFNHFGCATCHGQRGPTLANVYGQRRPLQGGGSIVADEAYLRESILYSTAKIVEGFQPIMPSYRGQMSEEQLMQIVAYIKSLADQVSNPPAREVRPAYE